MEVFLSFIIALFFIAGVIALAALFSKVQRLEREFRQFTQNLPAIVRAMIPHDRPEPAPKEKAHAPPVPVPEIRSTPPPRPAPVSPTSSPPPPRQIPQIPPPAPSRTREEWESLIGGKLLNRIGSLALIIGVGLFLKLAMDNNWINEWTRVLIGGAIGAGLLVLASVSDKRGLQIFAQGLVGAGISILYLSVYASFNYYHLVPQVVAFGLMTAVTATAFAHAFKYDSLAVALLAWLGGFLTPFLLSTEERNELGLFTYIALLDAGILIIALRKTAWAVLEPLALGATWLIFRLWYASDYTPDVLTLTLYFVIVFWGLFHALSTGKILRGEPSSVEMRQVTAAANAVFTYCALYALIEQGHHEWMGGVTLAFGVMYGLTAYMLERNKASLPAWIAEHTSIAVVLVVAATAIQFTGFTTVSVWSAEALLFAWMGSRLKKTHFSVFAFLLFFLAGFKLLVTQGALFPRWEEHVMVLFNRRAMTYVILAATAWTSTQFFRVNEIQRTSFFAAAISAGAALMVFILLTVETAGYFNRMMRDATADAQAGLAFNRWMALAVVWSTYGALLLWTGIRRETKLLFTAGLISLLCGIIAAALRGIHFEPIEEFTFLVNWRLGAMLAISLIGFAVVRRLNSDSGTIPWREDIFEILRVILVILLLVLVTGETRDYFQKGISFAGQDGEGSEEVMRLANLQQLSLSGVWLVFSIMLMVLGIWRRSRSLRIGSIILFGFTILKIFIYDLSFLDTIYRVVSFIGLGVILLTVSYLYQRYKGIIFDSPGKGLPPPNP